MIAPKRAPVLGEHREADVVAPAAADLHVAAREALAREPDALRERQRARVRRLNVHFDAVERELLLRALEKFHGNQTHAARYLDISRRTLIYRMEKFGLLKNERAT